MSEYHDKLFNHLHNIRTLLLDELDKLPKTARHSAGMYILKILQAEIEHLGNAAVAMRLEDLGENDEDT